MTSDTHLRAELMHHVTKLVEIRLHFMVLQQTRHASPGFGEVGHHRCHREPAFSIGASAAGLQPEAGGVAVLPFSGGEKGSED